MAAPATTEARRQLPSSPAPPMTPIDPVEPIQQIDPAEPMDAIDPADPIEAIDPVAPIDRIEPTELIERIDPVDPIDATDPIDKTDLIENAELFESDIGSGEWLATVIGCIRLPARLGGLRAPLRRWSLVRPCLLLASPRLRSVRWAVGIRSRQAQRMGWFCEHLNSDLPRRLRRIRLSGATCDVLSSHHVERDES